MPGALLVAALGLVLEDAELGSAEVLDDRALDGDGLEAVGVEDRVVVTEEDGLEGDLR